MSLDPLVVQQQISNLLLQVPELAEDDVLRADMIEAETEAHDLLRQLETIRRKATTMAAGIANTIVELEARLHRFERREESMRRIIFRIMELAHLRKVELPECTLFITAGQPKVLITDEAIIPDILCRISRTPDKARIKQMLKDGKEVRGATLSNSESHLTIRTT